MTQKVIYKNQEQINKLTEQIKSLEHDIETLKQEKICIHCGKVIPMLWVSKYYCSIDCEVQKAIKGKTKQIEKRIRDKYKEAK